MSSLRSSRLSQLGLLAGTALIAIVLVELGLRFLLFSEARIARRFGAELRSPGNFANPDSQDDYWKLQHRFASPERRTPTPRFDPVVGWTGHDVVPGTYAHERAHEALGKELVLLYGDSFAHGNTPPGQCFQDILAASDLGARTQLLNYGVGGYGLDQIYLLLERSLDLYADRDPFVIVGILVENDLDRSVLAFRSWPKPRLAIVDGALAVRYAPTEDVEAYLESHPISFSSYLYRLLLYRESAVPWRVREWLKGDHMRIGEKTALNREILRAIERALASRKLRHAYLLFHAEGAIDPKLYDLWQEPLIRATCAESGATVISTRPYLVAAAGGEYADCRRFYGHARRLNGHLTALGNVVAFQAMRDAIAGRGEAHDLAAALAQIERDERDAGLAETSTRTFRGLPARIVARGKRACVRPEVPTNGTEVPCVRAGEWGATEVALDLAATRTRFAARVRTRPLDGEACEGDAAHLTLRADARTVFRALMPRGDHGLAVVADLRGVSRLTLIVESSSGDAGCAWLCFDDLAIE